MKTKISGIKSNREWEKEFILDQTSFCSIDSSDTQAACMIEDKKILSNDCLCGLLRIFGRVEWTNITAGQNHGFGCVALDENDFFFFSRQTTFPPEGSPFSHRQFQQRKANKSCVVPCLLCTIIHGSIQQASYLLESRQAHFRTPQPLHRFHGPFDRSCHSCWKPASIVDLFAFVLIWLTVAPSGMVNVLLMVVVLWVLVLYNCRIKREDC